jgi:hypothetical protein
MSRRFVVPASASPRPFTIASNRFNESRSVTNSGSTAAAGCTDDADDGTVDSFHLDDDEVDDEVDDDDDDDEDERFLCFRDDLWCFL